MNTRTIEHQSRIRIYWLTWAAIVTFVLLMRFFIFSDASNDQLYTLSTIYGLGTWLPIMALNMVESRKLWAYL
ncbi:MAG TPA: hypothetical protein VNI58_07765, partial [Mariprofundaceae bacterium]|nr:hypothetical protein [Mariprofundaceae bacterium]